MDENGGDCSSSDEENWEDTGWSEPCVDGHSKGPHYKELIRAKSKDQTVLNNTLESENVKKQDIKTKENEDSLMSRMKLNDNKAGMEGLDREKINKIIYEASKGSRFFENELKREQQVNIRIEEQKKALQKLTENMIKEGERKADQLLEELDSKRDLSRTLVHVDMDAFYAAVEMRENPSLRHKPMGVGGIGMLSTTNYLARRYGVRAAMPGFIGKKLCPDLVIVKENFDKYREVSNQVRNILEHYDPGYSPMSLDEAYLDFTEHLKNRKSSTKETRTFKRMYAIQFCIHCKKDEKVWFINNTQKEGNDCGKTDESDRSINNSANRDTKKLSEETSDDKNSPLQNKSFEHFPNIMNEKSNLLESGHDRKIKVTIAAESCELQGHASERKESPWKLPKLLDCSQCGQKSEVTCTSASPRDVTFGLDVEDAVNEMRFRIEQRTQLTASAGIAPNTMLAKVCSDKNKPNGQYRIHATKKDVMDFISDLPIRKISGIGKVSEKMLSDLGAVKCVDLYEKRGILFHLYSQISFDHFMRICLGIGSTHLEREGERKSMSTERTFQEISRPLELYKKCHELCESLSEDLVSEDLQGRTVTLKLKTVDFEVKTKAQSLLNHTSDMQQIYEAARDLLKAEIQACSPKPLRLRLMGVRMSNFLTSGASSKVKQKTISKFLKAASEKPDDRSENKISPKKESQVKEECLPALPNVTQTSGEIEPSTSSVSNPTSNRLLKTMSKGEEFTCPVCDSTVLYTNVQRFHRHVDKCLQEQEKRQSDSIKREMTSTESTPIQSFSQNHELGLNSKVNAENVTEDTAAPRVKITNEELINRKDNDNESLSHQSLRQNQNESGNIALDSTDNKGIQHFKCPICNSPSCGDLELFNQHVDRCLNKQAIKDLLKEECGPQVEKKGTKREGSQDLFSSTKKKKIVQPNQSNHKTIDSFFRQKII